MTDDVLARLRAMQAGDVPVHGGRTLAYVYDSGLAEADRVGREAVAAYAGSNGLDPTAFPSLLTMENELVGFTADLLDAPPDVVGTITSGGTESVLLAVQGARDSRPDVDRPRMVLPMTAHAAFHKAAHYFGVEAVMVPVGADFRADPVAMARGDRRPDGARGGERPVVRARGRRPGHRDRRRRAGARACAATSTRASAAGCCRTPHGWGASYRRGRSRSTGVTSISVDLHKYAYTPKGTSLLLHRTAGLRRPQLFASARLARLHDAEPDHAVHQERWPARRGLGGREHDRRRRATSTLTRAGARRASTGWSPGIAAHPGAARGRRAGLDAGRVRDRRLVRRLHDHRRDDRGRLVGAAAALVPRVAPEHPPLALRGHRAAGR